jgi:hypothetical protein
VRTGAATHTPPLASIEISIVRLRRALRVSVYAAVAGPAVTASWRECLSVICS